MLSMMIDTDLRSEDPKDPTYHSLGARGRLCVKLNAQKV
jgi:hypothetical protein